MSDGNASRKHHHGHAQTHLRVTAIHQTEMTTPLSAAPALLVDNVSKTFRLPREQIHTMKERALHPFRSTTFDNLEALTHVSFDVRPGEFFGIVGRNGSGKSTLLKCMAGIYRADQGDIYVNGRVSTFIELGVGFNPDLAAFDNVMLNATMLGLSRQEARKRFDRIIEFAELERFVDLKIKNFSSGMLVRLAFSVMIQVDADILIIDEVLAVGDAAFQQKCFEEFARIRKSGATVVLVTHDMGAARRFCDRAMLLEHGHVVEVGDTASVADRYLQLNFSAKARAELATEVDPASALALPATHPTGSPDAADHHTDPADNGSASVTSRGTRTGDELAEITEVWVEDSAGARTTVVRCGDPFSVVFRAAIHADLTDPLFGVEFVGSAGDVLFAANNVSEGPSGTFGPNDSVIVRVAAIASLAPDRYSVTPAIARDRGGLAWHDRWPDAAGFVVTETEAYRGGLTAIPFDLAIETLPQNVTSPPSPGGGTP